MAPNRNVKSNFTMPKRSAPSSSTTTPKKKRRTDVQTDQQRLDFFFSPPTSRDKGKESEVASTNVKMDRLRDGIHSGTTRSLQGDSEVSTAISEFIDVDLLDEDLPPTPLPQLQLGQAGSSKVEREITKIELATGITTEVLDSYQVLSVNPLTFELGPEPWPVKYRVPYSFLAHTLETLSATRSRILILSTLTNAFCTILKHHPPSLLPALYLLSNTLSPPYLPIELGLGPSIISKAIQHVSGLSPAALKKLYNSTGDVGDVAFRAKSNLRTLIPHPPLQILAVHNALLQIAQSKGQGAAKHKQAIVEKLLVAAKGEETRFLARTLSQNLRVGAVRTSILTALARAMVLTPLSQLPIADSGPSNYHVTSELLSQAIVSSDSNITADVAMKDLNDKFQQAEGLVKRVFVQHPNFDHIANALLEGGLDNLAELVPLTVGIPLHPTLGSPTRGLDQVYDYLGSLPFTAEFKYDGQRAQIHGFKGEDGHVTVRIFSRHLEDMTTKYPDVVSLVKHIFERSPQMTSFIMDSEIVAVDPNDGSLKSFQELSNRARKDVQLQDVRIAVGVFAFDLMYLNGEILLESPFRHRRSLLRDRFPPLVPEEKGMARFEHVESCESENGKESVQDFWERAIESRCEGLMIKLLDSGEIEDLNSREGKARRKKPLPATYEADKRTFAWLKLKKDYVAGLGDSLDLVPIGAWHGNGRKAQWWSPILLGIYDPGSGRIVAVCKCMSGFTDEFYTGLTKRYPENSDTCSRLPLWDCDTGGLKPEVYFKPQEVWEIRGADITQSPVSVAALGLVSDSRGLSLRFPRFLRVRNDKSTEQASTPEFLARMWYDQQGKGGDGAGVDDGELLDLDVDEDEAVEETVEEVSD